jgi:hypothetical protein
MGFASCFCTYQDGCGTVYDARGVACVVHMLDALNLGVTL